MHKIKYPTRIVTPPVTRVGSLLKGHSYSSDAQFRVTRDSSWDKPNTRETYSGLRVILMIPYIS